MPDSLADILAPIPLETFFAEYWGKQPLHIHGGADKFAHVLDWAGLSSLVSQNGLWTGKSMAMVLDKTELPPAAYCERGIGRDGQETWLASITKIQALIRQGATLALNDIDSLTPALQRTAAAFETGLGGKAQANLYCSWHGHQAFRVHFDTHDVYAMHLHGRKDWRVYQCPIPAPIRHPAFAAFSDAQHEEMKGALWAELTMEPGDLLYLPRGWYHEALTATPGTFHIAWGVTHPIGVDVVSLLFERAVGDPLFRQSFEPLARTGPAGVAARLAAIGARLAELAADETSIAAFCAFMEGFRYHRGQIRLPDDALDAHQNVDWMVTTPQIAVIAGPHGPLLTDGRTRVPVPPGLDAPLAWVIETRSFTESALADAFPTMDDAARARFLADMAAMKVIARPQPGLSAMKAG